MKKLIFFVGVILSLGTLFGTQPPPQDLVEPAKVPDSGGPPAAPVIPPPQATIQNEMVQATLFLPNPVNGFYRGTRFDWSGTIAGLGYKGQKWFGPWFVKSDPTVEDMKFDPALNGWVAGTNNANMGSAEEFSATEDTPPIGYKEAAVGGTFLKIGVGVLRKPDEPKYNRLRLYEIVNGGKWITNFERQTERIQFIHQIDDPSGYGYVYSKTISLPPGKPELVVEHSLKNAGNKLIDTDVCTNHYLVINNLPPNDSDVEVNFPFDLKVRLERSKAGWIELHGPAAEKKFNEVHTMRNVQGDDRLQFRLEGFSNDPKDHEFKYKHRGARAVAGVTSDQPLAGMEIFAIPPVFAPKTFIKLRIEPGSEFKWRVAYRFEVVISPWEKKPKPAPAKPAA